MNNPIPGFAVDMQKTLQDLQRAVNSFQAQLAPGNNALDAAKAMNENPVAVFPLALDDASATPTGADTPTLVEIPTPHQTIYFQDSNSLSAYFYYRPVSKEYDRSSRWILMRKGDKVTWPYPVEKGYIYYPSQSLLTAKVLLLKYGTIDTATINTISLNAGSGSSIVTNPFDTTQDQPSVAIVAGAAAVPILEPLTTRTRAWIYNDSGGDILWVGDSNTADGRGIPIAPGETLQWTNTGPLYGFSVGGTTVRGAEERQ